jgi:deazaflavin-dependent oxidoreductase (nitroreductase family)
MVLRTKSKYRVQLDILTPLGVSRDREDESVSERLQQNQLVIDEFRSADGVVGGPFEGMPLLLLTTTGARSGQSRTTPMVYFRDGTRLVVFAANGGSKSNPAWYHNLLVNPVAQVEVGTEAYQVTGAETGSSERERLWAQRVAEAPQLAQLQEQAGRSIPVVALTRVGSDQAATARSSTSGYRVVETGVTEAGLSTITRDVAVPHLTVPGGRGLGRLWEADGVLSRADAVESGDDAVNSPAESGPPFPTAGGVRFWTVTVPHEDPDAAPPAFLKTPTIDVGIVLSGQIVLEMEDGTAAQLSTGQAFAQQGTPHRWRNPHPVDAVIAVVMMGRDL